MNIREKVARAIDPQWFGDSGKVLCNYKDQDKNYQNRARKNATAAITAFLEAAAEQGWQLVPREPTKDMKNIGAEAWLEEKPADYIYRAMLAAAPKYEVGE